ncbi:MAG: DUF1501 domain-containing protein [Fuerstiella sp.]|jgi:uncharacterized protein (DUF1501 family)|nr:DUF1501 domain-containing protein [Fuerstiella sp.]MCP4511262.1 DUF1501 domain-containing protein [Fuerstiella sp.]MDG2130150.1 DUF1501 domain-containing protein [Fuerstiella sp.]
MLSVVDGCSRRELLRIGAATVGGLTLPGLLAAQGTSIGKSLRNSSVVVLNLQGGPTQFETFDPKPDAPHEIRSITGDTPTSLPGVAFGGTFPRLAKLADRMAIVRSYRHGISSHGPAAMHVMAGGNPTGAMMGALFARVAGLTDPATGMPNNALVTAPGLGPQYKDLYVSVDRVSQTGTLAPAYRPFDPSAGGEIIDNMQLHVRGNRLDDRKSLLGRLDQLRRTLDDTGQIASAGHFQQQAFDVLARGVADAFDLSKEDPRLVERYDTGCFEPTAAIKKRNTYAKQFSPVALGKQMLLARRLCQAGCGFVTVTCGGWDMHGGGKEFTMADGLASLTPAVDKAVSAFIQDIQRRGLSEKILLVITGEFGRTPKINKNGGRDHWGNLCTLAFVGGGLKMGQVVGRSDRTASEPDSDPVSSSNVLATIMNTLFDVGELRLQTGIPKDIERIITGNAPIRELV